MQAQRAEAEAGRGTGTLTARYVAALATVAVLSIAGQVLVQAILDTHAADSRVINLAGRQRMLSQQLVKTALIPVRTGDARAPAPDLPELFAEWTRVHHGLRSGDRERGLPGKSSAQVAAAFARLEASFQGMRAALVDLMEGRPAEHAVARLLEHEPAFLRGMDEIVGLYERESSARVRTLQRVELALLCLVLLTLLLEGLFVFRPAVRRIRETVARLRRDIAERRQLEKELLVVAEREQTRIGMDLHDGLCQHLAGLAIMTRTLANQMAQGKLADPRDIEPELSSVARLTQEGLAMARQIARGLFPEVLMEKGLKAALEQACAMAESLYKQVECTCDVRLGELDIDRDTAFQLFRIAQEALGNAIRHGKADRVELSLVALAGRELCLRIVDNGVGLPEGQTPSTSTGIGLRSISTRARTIGAVLTIEPAQPTGTVVECRLDLVATTG